MAPAVLVYDGECSVCRKTVEWIRARAPEDAFEFLSLHTGEVERRFPVLDRAACKRAAHMILPDGRILVGEQTAPAVFDRVPGYGWAAVLLRLPGMRGLSRTAYRFFARRRHSIAWLFEPVRDEDLPAS